MTIVSENGFVYGIFQILAGQAACMAYLEYGVHEFVSNVGII